MKAINFYKSSGNGNIFIEINEQDKPQEMGTLTLMEANTSDGAVEKHVPVVSAKGGRLTVRVGSAPHPMTPEHFIEWILVKTTYGGTFINLEPGDEPEITTDFAPEEVVSVYAYCNLHGLWKAPEPVLPASFEQNPETCSAEFSDGCRETLSS